MLNPAIGTSPKNLTKADTWKQAKPLRPSSCADLLILAWRAAGARISTQTHFYCSTNAVDARVTRALMRNGRLATVGDQSAIVADALRKGKADPASCPGAAGMTEADWTALDGLAHGSK